MNRTKSVAAADTAGHEPSNHIRRSISLCNLLDKASSPRHSEAGMNSPTTTTVIATLHQQSAAAAATALPPATTATATSLSNQFCNVSSIRGMSKLQRYGRNAPMGGLWVIFILSMSILLSYGTIALVMEYLNYHTLINSRETLEVTPFPSITLCNHNPFRSFAVETWSKGVVLSPGRFNMRIRQLMEHAMEQNRTDWTKTLFFTDLSQTYFETIGRAAAKLIGHNDSSLSSCIMKLRSRAVMVGHADDCGIDVTVIQRPKYFNCLSVTVPREYTLSAEALGLNVRLDNEVVSQESSLGLMMDVFNQAHGLRVSLHEPGTYPRPEAEGYNVEPGKFTEMRFDPVKTTMISTPIEPCLTGEELLPVRHHRDGREFHYTKEACSADELGKLIYEKCNCQSSEYPLNALAQLLPTGKGGGGSSGDRINVSQVPFCNALTLHNNTELEFVLARIECAEATKLNFDSSADHCLPRCVDYSYDMHASVANWRPSHWQNSWISSVGDALNTVLSSNTSPSQLAAAKRDILNYIHSKNLRLGPTLGNNTSSVKGSGSSLPKESAFLVVTRSRFITRERVQSLSLTDSALLSRVGGLSSITLGVTFATVFELVEFIYLVLSGRRHQRTTVDHSSSVNANSVVVNSSAVNHLYAATKLDAQLSDLEFMDNMEGNEDEADKSTEVGTKVQLMHPRHMRFTAL